MTLGIKGKVQHVNSYKRGYSESRKVQVTLGIKGKVLHLSSKTEEIQILGALQVSSYKRGDSENPEVQFTFVKRKSPAYE